jgi:hypothetical protein
VDPEDDFTHALHQRGEQSFAGILLRGGAFEEGINPVGVKQALSYAPGHDTDGAFLDERGKHGVEQPPCHLQASCVLCYLRQQFTKYGQMLKGLAVKVDKTSKHVPGSDKVSQNTSSRSVFISLLDLWREDFSLMSDV